MAVEIFHNLKELKDPAGFEHLLRYDKFLIIRRGQDRDNLIDLFGVDESISEMVFLLTVDDRSRDKVKTVHRPEWLTEIELEYLWNIADCYSFGYEHEPRNYFTYRVGDINEYNESEKLDLLKKVARIDKGLK